MKKKNLIIPSPTHPMVFVFPLPPLCRDSLHPQLKAENEGRRGGRGLRGEEMYQKDKGRKPCLAQQRG